MLLIFADQRQLLVFSCYVCLFVNHGLLVTASKESDGSYAYNTVTVVLLVELLKLFISACLLLRSHTVQEIKAQISGSYRLLLLYFIPSFLYCLYNNLAFVNLRHYDPVSYFLLLNFRTVTTGVAFQILFKKRLNCRQWAALILLTVGCVIKQLRWNDLHQLHIALDFHLVMMLAQVLCSCFAGVYNEFLLKDRRSVDVPLMLQNVYMYVDSTLTNTAFLIVAGSREDFLSSKALTSVLLRPSVLAVMTNHAVAGIVTSVFLKYLDSVLKTFAGAVELLLTAVAAHFLFKVQIDASVLISLILVCSAMYLYSVSPAQNSSTVSPSPSEHNKLQADRKV